MLAYTGHELHELKLFIVVEHLQLVAVYTMLHSRSCNCSNHPRVKVTHAFLQCRCVKVPLFPTIPIDHVIPDVFHLFLRVTDVLFNRKSEGKMGLSDVHKLNLYTHLSSVSGHMSRSTYCRVVARMSGKARVYVLFIQTHLHRVEMM